MTSADSNFNFLCGRPHGAGPLLPPSPFVHLSLTPFPPPCERHKWMAPAAWLCYGASYKLSMLLLLGLHIYCPRLLNYERFHLRVWQSLPKSLPRICNISKRRTLRKKHIIL